MFTSVYVDLYDENNVESLKPAATTTSTTKALWGRKSNSKFEPKIVLQKMIYIQIKIPPLSLSLYGLAKVSKLNIFLATKEIE